MALRAFLKMDVIEFTQEFNLFFSVPADALAAVALFFKQWTKRGEALSVRVIPFYLN